jgi:hypothetical protein
LVSEKSTVNAFVQDKLNSEGSGSTYEQKYVPFSATSRSKMSLLTGSNNEGTQEKKASEFNNSELEIRNLEIESRH